MKKYRTKLVLTVICLLIGIVSNAQEERYQVAYLYNFTNFIEWPGGDVSSPFVIGVLGQNAPIISELKKLAEMKKVHGRAIVIKTFNNAQSISKCEILFVSRKYIGQISEVQKKINGTGVLIVSDSPDAVNKGAAISFILKEGKLNFRIAQQNAEKYGLKVNSRLAALAVN